MGEHSGNVPTESPRLALETITIPRMPALWDKDRLIVSHRAVSGALAKWAVMQSPYTVPNNLGAAIEQFMRTWKHDDFAAMSSAELHKAVHQTIEACSLIVAWNSPKIGSHEYVFVDRYSQPKPDYDFIDLHALSRNIAHDITLEEQVFAAQDTQRT